MGESIKSAAQRAYLLLVVQNGEAIYMRLYSNKNHKDHKGSYPLLSTLYSLSH